MSCGWSTPRAAKVTGVTVRQLDYWHRSGVITASIASGIGSGSRRKWSATDIEIIGVLGYISSVTSRGDNRLPTTTLAAVVDMLRGPTAVNEGYLIIHQHRVAWRDDLGAVGRFLTEVPCCIVADLSAIPSSVARSALPPAPVVGDLNDGSEGGHDASDLREWPR